MTPRQLKAKAQHLASRFYDDVQTLCDDPGMDGETATGAVFDALIAAQSYAETARDADPDD